MSSRLDDGHQTLISFASNPTILLYEKEVTPPGVDGGGAIDTTTMINSVYRTMAPKALITLTPVTMTAAYNPAVYTQIIDLINVVNLITCTFPDSSTVAFWGWLNKFNPGAHVEGTQPTAEIEIIPGNQSAATGLETAPTINPSV